MTGGFVEEITYFNAITITTGCDSNHEKLSDRWILHIFSKINGVVSDGGWSVLELERKCAQKRI